MKAGTDLFFPYILENTQNMQVVYYYSVYYFFPILYIHIFSRSSVRIVIISVYMQSRFFKIPKAMDALKIIAHDSVV